MNGHKLAYRAEIDGLRAIAVVSVILYHAQLPVWSRDWFTGGYVGVDIFFVISGYLISRIIFAELCEKGSFSWLNFYERRARRIMPMLLAVILVSIPFAWLRLLPADIVDYADSVLASLFFTSNIYFFFNTTEYGADSSLLKPLLHTWSLGIEEQFYVLFPLLAVALFRFGKRYLLGAFVFLSLASLCFAELTGPNNADLNFYLPFSRFWELAVGALLAFSDVFYRFSINALTRSVMTAVGLSLIGFSIVSFDGATPHPGIYTLVPVTGVAMVIGFASAGEPIGRTLGNKMLVGIGLISYSAYLWHFPIFAFSRLADGDPSRLDKLLWIALTFILSILSYFVIETPFRSRQQIRSRTMWWVMLVAVAMVSALMCYIKYTDGVWSRYTKSEQLIIQGFNVEEYRALVHPTGQVGARLRNGTVTDRCNMRIPEQACRFGDERVVYLGDSFVGHYERAFIDTLGLGFISLTYEQCPFVSEHLWFGNFAECPLVNEQRKALILGLGSPKIFVISVNEGQFRVPKQRTESPLEDARKRRRQGRQLDSSVAWSSYFEHIRWLTSLGHKVVLIRTIPKPTLDGGKWLAENLQYVQNMDFPAVYNNTDPAALLRQDALRYPEFDSDSVLVVDPVAALCDLEQNRCLDVKQDYGPLYNGGRHLSYLGAALVAQMVDFTLRERGWIQ
ncbi:hypothetical protein GCM10008090_18500 [Arenicella chitinivorans]|uniref:Acyltransferase n=1 Tax=Arenicella chitinivorans TaxID=1329800 RepID=A0A918RQD4_9GAMM|nr:acyltransferase family protein [Arenicella chitinivorans]GHA08903.1 hypothetical protein GCM10008090_18500 [Arenicella chitinivorans]